ncbi:MAG: DUF72 domain-containing protein [Bryobacteraceae bacterium]|jgi:uncharacterized protein YecE (DUF72 family)
MATLYAGTSGFAYPSWKPAFYPAGLAANRFLQHYAGRLNCVEINYTFRRLPSAATLAAWVEATPPGFVFAVKAHMRITHMLRLKNAEQATDAFLKAIDPLRSARRLGPVLFQLPPNLKRDLPLLRDYLALLPDDIRFAFEFRHESWLADEVYDELRRRHAALCVAESEKLEVPEVVTAAFVYYRLRKPDYTDREVDAIAARASEMLAAGHDLYALFKHEDSPEGALHAQSLLKKAG